MKANHGFTKEYDVDKPLINVYSMILDFKKFGHFHPHMRNVDLISQISPQETEYEVDEKLLLYGFIPLFPNYKATVLEKEKNKHIQYTSQVKKNVHLTIDFNFSEDKKSGKTKVIEKVDVKANSFVAAVFLGLLKKAHIEVFQNFCGKYCYAK